MNKLYRLCQALLALSLFVALVKAVHADAGTGWDQALWIQRGNIANFRQVSVASNTGTAIWPGSLKQPDSVCFNNSSFTVWIGSTSATQQNTTHQNILTGFPVLSSATFRLDGSMTAAIYATSDAGKGTGDIRCFDGQVN